MENTKKVGVFFSGQKWFQFKLINAEEQKLIQMRKEI